MIRIKEIILKTFFLSFALFPILPNKIKGLPVILLFFGSLFLYKKKGFNWKWLIINSSLFILYLISMIYTDNVEYGIKKLETGLSLFGVPVAFFVFLNNIRIDKESRLNFKIVFILSTAIFSLISLVYICLEDTTYFYKDFYSNKFRINVENLKYIGQHPIYASLFIGISLILGFYAIKENWQKLSSFMKTILLFSCLIGLTLLIMLSSRGVILSLIVLASIYLIKSSKNLSWINRSVFLLFFVLAIASLICFNRRINEMIRFETYTSLSTNYSNSYRFNIYKCSLSLIKENWLFGYGVGDAQDELNKCYENMGEILLKSNFNSHNQYLDIVIKTGFIGIITFFGFIFANIKMAMLHRNKILITIMIFYLLNFLTENILARQSGLILFMFLVHFFRVDNKELQV